MLPFFPKVYEDELLHSIVARYQRLSGSGFIDTSTALFGKATKTVHFQLPTMLDALARSIPADRCLSADRLVDDHTLFPYYSAWRPRERIEELRHAMLSGTGSITKMAGLLSADEVRLDALRFCLECNSEMLAEHRELHWKRSHQLPGVLVCTRHEMPLRTSDVTVLETRHANVAASVDRCGPGSPAVFDGRSTEAMEALLALARFSQGLLQVPTCPETEEAVVQRRRNMAIEAGFRRSSAKVDVEGLVRRFEGRFGTTLTALSLPAIDFDRASTSWLALLIRPSSPRTGQLKQAVFECLLGGLPAAKANPKPVDAVRLAVGRGPWACLNPLAPHCGQPVVREIRVSMRHKVHRVSFFCSCGHVYERVVTHAGSVSGPHAPKHGHSLPDAIRAFAAAGTTLKLASRRLNLSPTQIILKAARHEISHRWRTPRSRTPPGDPNLPVRTARIRKPQRDWAALDEEVASRVATLAGEILKTAPPVRISRNELERRMRGEKWLGFLRPGKMPLTLHALARHRETIPAFTERRAVFWAEELLTRGEALNFTRMVKTLHVQSKNRETYRAMIEEAIVGACREGSPPG